MEEVKVTEREGRVEENWEGGMRNWRECVVEGKGEGLREDWGEGGKGDVVWGQDSKTRNK